MSSLFDTTTRTRPVRRLAAPSRDVAEWMAQQTLRMHAEPPAQWCTGRCAQCPPDSPTGCLHLAWALTVLHAHQPQPHGRTRP